MPLRKLEPDIRAVLIVEMDPSIVSDAVRRRLQVPARIAAGTPTVKPQLASSLRQILLTRSYQAALQVRNQPRVNVYEQRRFFPTHLLRLPGASHDAAFADRASSAPNSWHGCYAAGHSG
jgi:hypothetical protein